MAIEFHCPYCTAVMRVPDEFAAKPGRCPKCDTVVLVPDVRPPQPESRPDAVDVSEQPTQIRPPRLDANSPAPGKFPGVVTTASPPSIAGSLKKRRRKRGAHRVWMVGIPVIFFLLLLSVISWYTLSRLPSLSGQLPASLYSAAKLPVSVISWSTATGLTDNQLDTLRTELELSPEAFVSTQMKCRIRGNDDGLEVSLSTTDETSWYVVNPAGHAALVLWKRKNQDRLTAQRNIRFQEAFRQYCKEKLLVIEGQAALIDAERYRDSVGLGACCSGFGSVVEAVVQNRIVRCAFEDDAGQLYFCLPRGVVSFQMRGRTFPDGHQPFSGQFEVVVSGKIGPETSEGDAIDEPPQPDIAEDELMPDGMEAESSEIPSESESAQSNDSGSIMSPDNPSEQI